MTNVVSLKQFKTVQPKQQDMEAKLKQAAEMYEQQFLGEMVKAMRATVDHSEMTEPSMAENIYRSHLDQEYVKSWVGRGGIGLSDLIVDQMKEKLGMNRPSGGMMKLKPEGPIPLDKKNNFRMHDLGGDEKRREFKIETVKGEKVSSLWDGIIESVFKSDDGKSVIQVNHDNGIKSRLVFNGPNHGNFKLHDTVKAGAELGTALDGNISLQIIS